MEVPDRIKSTFTGKSRVYTSDIVTSGVKIGESEKDRKERDRRGREVSGVLRLPVISSGYDNNS